MTQRKEKNMIYCRVSNLDAMTSVQKFKYLKGRKPTNLLELAGLYFSYYNTSGRIIEKTYASKEDAWKDFLSDLGKHRVISFIFAGKIISDQEVQRWIESAKKKTSSEKNFRNYKECKGYSQNAEGKALYLTDKWTDRVKQAGRTNAVEPARIKWAKAEAERHKIKLAIERMKKHTLRSLPLTPQKWNDPDYFVEVGGRVIVLQRREIIKLWKRKHQYPSLKNIVRTAYLLREDWDRLDDETLSRNFKEDEPWHKYNIGKIAEKEYVYEARGNWIKRVVLELLPQVEPAFSALDKHCLESECIVAAIKRKRREPCFACFEL